MDRLRLALLPCLLGPVRKLGESTKRTPGIGRGRGISQMIPEENIAPRSGLPNRKTDTMRLRKAERKEEEKE